MFAWNSPVLHHMWFYGRSVNRPSLLSCRMHSGISGVGCSDHRHRTLGESLCLQETNATSTDLHSANDAQYVSQTAIG